VVVTVKVPTQVKKRDGRIVDFDPMRIMTALTKCFSSFVGKEYQLQPKYLSSLEDYTTRVINVLSVKFANEVPTVEQVQDTVVFVLQSAGEYEAAERYIIYRYERNKAREAEYIPEDVLAAFKEDEQYFPTQLQRFQFYDKYSRFIKSQGRRETWKETVERSVNFLWELVLQYSPAGLNTDKREEVRKVVYEEVMPAILRMEVMPSMRLLAMAGEAARRDHSVLYNCSYLPLDSVDSFCELFANSMAGCGVGFSVESTNISKLPVVAHQLIEPKLVKEISDSAEGWIDALRFGLVAWFNGLDTQFDYSKIRPKGSILKIKGGRASGPEPLRECLDFIRDRILARQGKRLTTLDCHDIACAIGGAVVSGGVRRTALISIFDEDDELMLHCKDGDFAKANNQRWNANNSAVWTNVERMTQREFVKRMWNMFESERGEPGIFVRENAQYMLPERRAGNLERNKTIEYGLNPCGEIILRPFQFCNLSSVVARSNDTPESLERKVRLATIIGTIQSCATFFPNLRDIWSHNCHEERLLGVDISGQLDCPLLVNSSCGLFANLQAIAIGTNVWMADLLGINRSAAITCVKPSGNSSVLLNCSSGLHPRWAKYYIRNVRVAASSSMAKVLRDAGVQLSPENGQDLDNPHTYVVSFPVKSPDGAIVREKWSAIEQCEYWLKNKIDWTEHNPSVTIYYKNDEILDLMQWVYTNITSIGGMSFLPYSDAKYDQLPYIEITEHEYEEMVEKFPKNIPFERLYIHDNLQDHTNATQTLACEGPVCLIE
jgi:ribonucleoside-diphosphate reductase alpha chain